MQTSGRDDCNQNFFVEFQSDNSGGDLVEAELLSRGSRRLSLRIAAEINDIQPNSVILLHWKTGDVFYKQPHIVVALDHDEERKMLLVLEPTGEAVPAKTREAYRVPLYDLGLSILLQDEECSILDISATGLSVSSRTAHPVGSVLEICLKDEDPPARGSVRVQARRSLSPGKWRIGLYALGPEGALLRRLGQVSAEVQRRLLARRGGLVSPSGSGPKAGESR